MKIYKDKDDKKWYLTTENFLAHIENDWKQIWGNWNWIEFNVIKIYFENDKKTGGYEFEFMLLGLGFRMRYNYDDSFFKSLEDYR